MIEIESLVTEIHKMMKENDEIRDRYKSAMKDSSSTTDRLYRIGQVYGEAIDRKLKLLELMIISKDVDNG